MTDTPADERCESCHRLDPVNCPCPPEITPEEPTLHAVHVALVTPETAPALVDVADERVRQVRKWGVQTRPDGTDHRWDVIANVAKDNVDRKAAAGTLTWTDILNEEVQEAFAETDPAALREELVQVAAVALAWVEDIDRKASREETLRAFRESEMVGQAIADGRLPLRQPGASS